jgi:hypothetical protein
MTAESRERACPYCMEAIGADASKCKHCGSAVAPTRPSHGGICPYCKGQIHAEATRCKHCRSDVRNPEGPDCGCGGGVALRARPVSSVSAGSTDCLLGYVRCRRELGRLGVPDHDAIDFCAFQHWGCTVRNAFLDQLL